ncbi:ATP-binding protein [Mycolicibacterium rhodesiae]|uniref:Histidine kinase n=1 Tax=Mycolicibacterium rhodesiae TaxID=36814 RepID=A0A1X0IIQ5_MYCRH|nr:ATP-binding protein [Mycolicibacterium rhodesiae]MCV7346428.1 ATP-binding protein [Mycolicibacterium rhodesiae]ORB47576.1 hypothetical protein BST42_27395 [Mycolicibacterium rhodesiae]
MTRIQVQAGTTLLRGFIRTPATGLCELVWNAFDEDAHNVSVTVEYNSLDSIDQIVVADDGNGMTLETAKREFAKVGDSWKITPGTKSQGGRPVHGRHGRGRYSAFAIGGSVEWYSIAKGIDEKTLQLTVAEGRVEDIDFFDIEDQTKFLASEETGTRVSLTRITPEAQKAFDRREQLVARLTSEFALHLDRFPDFKLIFCGSPIDPKSVIEDKSELPLELPGNIPGVASIIVIEWNLPSVERRLYLCDSQGSVKDELKAGVKSPGTQFTAYVKWDGFSENNLILESEGEGYDEDPEDESESPAQIVVAAARKKLREHLGELTRRKEAATVQRWIDEGIYPYKDDDSPKTPVERATREAFQVVAMAASKTVDESKSQRTKALALGLLKETFESDPESLFPLLKKVTNLPAARINELKKILERTSLTQLIQAGHRIGNRVDFLNGISEILFERQSRQRLLERRQLHRILAHETWIFGEEWSLTGDDERLSAVLKKFLKHLGGPEEVELTDGDIGEILREDGSIAIPDLVLGRKVRVSEDRYEYLVVELKRPKHKLNDEDVLQLRSYAVAITKDERFAQPNVSWNFILVGNDTTDSVEDLRSQTNLPFGMVQQSQKYSVWVKKWPEIIGGAEHRMKFVQDSLQYESNKDKGLDYLRTAYASYLPDLEDPEEGDEIPEG